MLATPRKRRWAGFYLVITALLAFAIWQVFVPRSFAPQEDSLYNVQSGTGTADIASELKKEGIIKSSLFFNIYAFLSGNHEKLQAGVYDVSPSMSVAALIQKLASGDIARRRITVVEGWDLQDIANYVDQKNIYFKDQFLAAAKQDYSADFAFLKTKPKNVGLEGYLFPDTYYVPANSMPQDFIRMALANTDRKITADMRKQIAKDKRTIAQVITMASILEKEVPTLKDKKIVSGILWKRLANGWALQVDSTINYITNKNDAGATLADLKIDSQYNTYKYTGLPLGPISSPGLDSIMAAVYPTKSEYWFYLSSNKTGETVFSRTYEEHKAAMAKHLKGLTQN